MPSRRKINKWSKEGYTNRKGKRVFGTGSILHNLKSDREKSHGIFDKLNPFKNKDK